MNLLLVEAAVVHSSMYWYWGYEQFLFGKVEAKNRYHLFPDGDFFLFSYQHVQTQAVLFSGNLFSFGTQRIHLRSFLGRIPHDIYVVKKGLIAHLQSHLTVLCYLCETKKYKH